MLNFYEFVSKCRSSRRLAVLVVFVALFLDNMLMTAIGTRLYSSAPKPLNCISLAKSAHHPGLLVCLEFDRSFRTIERFPIEHQGRTVVCIETDCPIACKPVHRPFDKQVQLSKAITGIIRFHLFYSNFRIGYNIPMLTGLGKIRLCLMEKIHNSLFPRISFIKGYFSFQRWVRFINFFLKTSFGHLKFIYWQRLHLAKATFYW